MFNKAKKVNVLLFTTTGQLKKFKIKSNDLSSDDELVTYKERTYKYSPSDIYYHKGTPTIMFYEGSSKPIKISQDGETSNITPKELNKAVNNNIVKDLMSSTNEQNTEQLLLIGLGVCVIGLIGLGWYVGELNSLVVQQGTQIDKVLQGISELSNLL